MTGTLPGWHCIFGIIGFAFFVSRKCNPHDGCLRAVRSRKKTGFAADSGKYVGVAHFGRYGSLCEVFCVYGIAARIMGADARNRQFAGFAADLCSFHAVWYGEARVTQAFVNTGHDLAPDIFVEGRAAVYCRQFLVFIAAAPYTCGIVRSVTDEPDIVVVAGRTTLTCC